MISQIMGEHAVSDRLDEAQSRAFMKALLADVRALEVMLERGMFETGRRRVGAEQEMFLVDADGRPAPVACEVLEGLEERRLTTELARFNLEANIDPRRLEGKALSEIEDEVRALVRVADEGARRHSARVLLAGILPTLRRGDLTLENMTPIPRYRALNDTLMRLRGGDVNIAIKGIDELNLSHDNVMFEACNTSFQVHFQVAPDEFAKLYNVAQLVTAPVLAAAANSPLLFGSRLWHETRVALFSSSIDDRSSSRQARGFKPRVTFGDQWVNESVLEIFREQIARFRVVLSTPTSEDPMQVVERGEVPALEALRLHNGTVYRWNRACYGVNDGVAHLRIENRVLPSGPTILDELANAAFFFGLMAGVLEKLGDPKERLEFDAAKDNFFAAARHGLKAQFTWDDGETLTAAELIRGRLLPLAREGLEHSRIAGEDIDRYLGVIEARVGAGKTGASWALDSLSSMGKEVSYDMRERRLVSAMLEHQGEGAPVHSWEPCEIGEMTEQEEVWRRGLQRVGQFMSTDLFTVRPNDLVDLAASVMDWEHIKHVPVEDDQGHLVGLVTHRDLLRLVARGAHEGQETLVKDIMITDPMTVSPDLATLDAMKQMREQGVGCLPVVEDDRLVGIITQSDLIRVSAHLLEKFLKGER
jgi:CBS domain-containing protein/gamma-glutamyl:cysteine ligase YbdK (ATP-grasp superfamily)